MSSIRYADGFRLNPIANGSPEALVVLLNDIGDSAATLTPFAARWASSVPTTGFIAFDGVEEADPPSGNLAHTMLDLEARTEQAGLDRAAGHLESLLEQQLRTCQFDASRLVLVGFGYGGTLALHMLLRRGWGCAGVLGFATKLMRPLPRFLRIDRKVRLVECVTDHHDAHSRMREVVSVLTARGVDTRGVLLMGSVLSDAAIRHGAAYLVELVATAQRGNRLHPASSTRPVATEEDTARRR